MDQLLLFLSFSLFFLPSFFPSLFSPFFFLLLFLHCYTNQQFFLFYYHRQRRMCWKDASEVWVQLVWDTLLCKVTCHGFFICWYFYVHMRRDLISLVGEKNQHLVDGIREGVVCREGVVWANPARWEPTDYVNTSDLQIWCICYSMSLQPLLAEQKDARLTSCWMKTYRKMKSFSETGWQGRQKRNRK